MTKAIYDKSVPTRNLVTTISGIVLLILTILTATGTITEIQQQELNNYATIIITAVAEIWGAVSGIILVFKAKDA